MAKLKEFASNLKLAAIVSVALVIFAGCSKDKDDKNPVVPNPTNNLVGTIWQSEVDEDGDYVVIHFQTATTGIYTELNEEDDDEVISNFTYSYAHPNVNLTLNHLFFGAITLPGTVDGNKMTFTLFGMSEEFTKQ